MRILHADDEPLVVAKVREIREVLPETKLIVVTMHAHHAYVQEAFRTGVAGYVVKKKIVSELVRAFTRFRAATLLSRPRCLLRTTVSPDAPGGISFEN